MAETGRLSRREFGAIAAAAPLAFGRPLAAAAPLTAAAVVERIRAGIGVEWKADSIDAIKAGDAAVAVTGVVTTAMATLAVLREAVKAGANLVVTHEPAFFGSSDARQPPPARGGFQTVAQPDAPPDPVYAAKNDFVDRHGLVIFRLRDHWRLRRPSPLAEGLGDALGWRDRRAGADPARYEIRHVALGALASRVGTALGAKGGVRVVGDPKTSVRTVVLLPGFTPLAAALEVLPSADVVVAGEMREWESVEYARDAVYAGQPKGLVLVGRLVSEEPGMRACARWLERLVPEVPVRHIAAGDPYWRP